MLKAFAAFCFLLFQFFRTSRREMENESPKPNLDNSDGKLIVGPTVSKQREEESRCGKNDKVGRG